MNMLQSQKSIRRLQALAGLIFLCSLFSLPFVYTWLKHLSSSAVVLVSWVPHHLLQGVQHELRHILIATIMALFVSVQMTRTLTVMRLLGRANDPMLPAPARSSAALLMEMIGTYIPSGVRLPNWSLSPIPDFLFCLFLSWTFLTLLAWFGVPDLAVVIVAGAVLLIAVKLMEKRIKNEKNQIEELLHSVRRSLKSSDLDDVDIKNLETSYASASQIIKLADEGHLGENVVAEIRYAVQELDHLGYRPKSADNDNP